MSYCKTQIGDLVTLRQGFAINKKTNHHMSEEPTMLHLLRIGDMKDGNFSIFVRDTIPEKFIAKENDIIYTRTGQVGLVFRNQYGVVHNNCFTVTSNDEDVLSQQYLYYALQEESFYEEANSRATGAAQPDLPHGAFNSIEIFLPPVEVQRRITNILDAYNSLIDNNQKQIKLLEEAAQRLYKEWFVDLRFPGYEGMEIVDGVPEGWKKHHIDDVFHIKYGKTLPTSKITKEGKYPVYGANGVIGFYLEKNVDDYVVLITSRGNGSGDVLRTHDKESFVTNNSFIVKPYDHSIRLPFIHQLMKNTDFKNICTGSAQPQLTNNSISTLLVLLPSCELISQFCDIESSWYDKIEMLLTQNRLLSQARDRLLPKLMSGEIEV